MPCSGRWAVSVAEIKTIELKFGPLFTFGRPAVTEWDCTNPNANARRRMAYRRRPGLINRQCAHKHAGWPAGTQTGRHAGRQADRQDCMNGLDYQALDTSQARWPFRWFIALIGACLTVASSLLIRRLFIHEDSVSQQFQPVLHTEPTESSMRIRPESSMRIRPGLPVLQPIMGLGPDKVNFAKMPNPDVFGAVSTSSNRVSRRVAIIGGGMSGVASARFLLEAGHMPILFDQSAILGGVWSPQPANPVVYSHLITNLPTAVMASTDLDFSFSPRSFVNVEQMGNYIQDYARAFSVLPIVRSRANVTRVLRAPKQSVTAQASNGFGSGMERNGWQVTWKDISKNSEGKQHMETFDAVVVANGHYNVEYWADIAGATEWLAQGKGRKIVHAKSYKQPQQFLDKTVLIVGARPSGQDIARELIGVARWIYVMDKSCKQSVTEGTCTHVPISSRVTIDGLLLHESVTLPGLPIDTIILATGYLYDFPFLSASELGMADFRQRFVAPLYQHVLHTSIPSLAFIGLPSSIPAPMLMFEAQARFVASEWSKQKLSSSE
eukprot:g9528.t1